MQRGDIYLAKIRNSEGSVQSGLRPVIVIQNEYGNSYSNTTIVCCITSANKKEIPTHVKIGIEHGLSKPSTILCEQIFTISKEILLIKIGKVEDKETLKKLDQAIKISLDL